MALDRVWTHWTCKVVSAFVLASVFAAGLWLMVYVGDRSPQRITSGLLSVYIGDASLGARWSGHLFICNRDSQNPVERTCTTTIDGRVLTISIVFADVAQTTLLRCQAAYGSEVLTPYCVLAFAGHRDLLPAALIENDLGLSPEVFTQYKQQYPIYAATDNDYLAAVTLYGFVFAVSLAFVVSQWVPRRWFIVVIALVGTLSVAWFGVSVLGFLLGFRWGFLD